MKKFKIDEYSKKEAGFAVPENYFENLESRIFNLIETREVKVISIFQQPKYWITAIAAIFIIGLFFSISFNNSNDESFANEEFLTTQTDLTTEDLAEHLTENDLKTLEENLTVYDQEIIDLTKENL
ncbi:MAG: hypothetical protein H7250_06130 [Flavobacterium sp.]|nr:hypothetical protein [Flavobacterium sp.]